MLEYIPMNGTKYKQNKTQKYQNTNKTKYNMTKYKTDKLKSRLNAKRENTNMTTFKVIRYE